MQSQGSRMGEAAKGAAKAVANKLIKKFLIWIFHAFGWPILLVVIVFTILFGPVAGAAGQIYNFLSTPYGNTVSDQELKALYDKVSASTVDEDLVKNDPGLAMYQVPWSLFAAIDKVLNNCENPKPKSYVALLKPMVNMRDSIVRTVTTVEDSDMQEPSVSEKEETVKLVDTVDTYKGIYKHNYVSSTTTTTSTKTEERSISFGGNSSHTATIKTTVTVTKEILCDIKKPTPLDYTRYFNALTSFGIANKNDQDLVWELAKNYDGQRVDLSQPVDYLMDFEGDSPVTMGSGGDPPPSWIPWFLAAAEKYHGNTPVGEFEALLMAIGFTESSFSESRSMVSSANAKGPFQFTDATWYDYGIKQLGYVVEDVWIAAKAVMATALMESQAGASNGTLGGIRAALWRYNQSTEYGNLVMGRMYYYGKFTGWVPDVGAVVPGSASTQGFYWPVPSHGNISTPFGPRIHPITKKAGMHTGIDIPAPLMTPIIAVKDGVIEVVDTNNSIYGYMILISHEGGVETLYGHMQDIAPGIVEGVQVKAGQTIAYVGTRGMSTGNHLHFETHYNDSPVNPLLFVNQP